MPIEYKDKTPDRTQNKIPSTALEKPHDKTSDRTQYKIRDTVPEESHDNTLYIPDITAQDKLPDAHNNISILFAPKDRYEVISELKKTPENYNRYIRLSDNLRSRLLDFLCGKKTLPLTYDPFFKKLFNTDITPERLESFIGSIIKRKVKIKNVLTQEESLLQGASLLIMDIVVELDDGSFANVEIQKISYLFPAQRMSCYSADLLLRQYARVRGEKGDAFTYKDLKKVYTIIIFEDSPKELREDSMKDTYVHIGKTVFSSKAKLDMLQEYYLLPLDVFQESYYSKGNRDINTLNGWLALLSTDTVDRLDELISDYPWLEGIVADMAGYLERPEEVIGMFSDALKILDENTVHYMIEQQKEELEKAKQMLAEKDSALAEKELEMTSALAEKDNEIQALKAKLEKMHTPIQN